MRKKSKIIILAFLLVLVIGLSHGALAQDRWWTSPDGSATSGGSRVTNAILDPISTAINVLARLGSSTVNLPLNQGRTTALTIILTFILLFALIYPATAFIPVFKDAKNIGARKAFAIAFAILVVFFSPIAVYVYEFINVYLSALVAFALFVLAIVLFWFIIKYGGRGFAVANKVGAGTKKINLENKKITHEVEKEREILKREDHALRELGHLTDEEREMAHNQEERWRNIRHRIAKMDSVSTPAGEKLRQQLVSEIAALLHQQHKQEEVNDYIMKLAIRDDNMLARLRKLISLEKSKIDSIKTDLERKGYHPMEAERLLKAAQHNAALIHNLTKRIEKEDVLLGKYESKISQYTGEVIMALKAGDSALAGQLTDKIIAEIRREERLLNEIKYTEGRMIKIDHQVYNEILNSYHLAP